MCVKNYGNIPIPLGYKTEVNEANYMLDCLE